MTNARSLARLVLVSALALGASLQAARADDIDIYSMPNTEGFRPNVLIMLDNTANWSSSIPTPPCSDLSAEVKATTPNKEEGTKMGAQKCALYKLISSLSWEDLGQFNFALMLFNESPDSSGYPRQAFIHVRGPEDKQRLLNLITGLGINRDKGNNASTAEAFYEAYQWFAGSTVHLGNKTATKHDPAAFTDGGKTRYVSPGVGCAKNHIIYLANGAPADNDNRALELLKRLHPGATRYRIPTSEGVGNSDEANWADEFAAFFNLGSDLDPSIEGSQNINVHAIAVTGASSDGNYPNFVSWIAKQGGGLYQQASNSDQIILAMTKILNQIRAANSVFSSASLPVSANTQGTYLNQVFIGMFRPDGNALPRWVGNLKQYQFVYDAQRDTLQLADITLTPAVSPTSGFIDSGATSFWTHSSSFWINVEASSGGRYSRSDAPDGERVEKGGVAQLLRESHLSGTAGRTIYTCPGAACGTDVDLSAAGASYQFSTSNGSLTPAMFGATVDAARKNLIIDFVRGTDNVTATNVANPSVAKDQLGTAPTGATVRPSIHGDVLHSRPVAINYGGTRGVVVFYGSNDGLLRAVNGNQTGIGAGQELWAFVAPEHFGSLNRLRENDPEVRYPSTPLASAAAQPRNYFFDGPIGAYQNTQTGVAMLFVGMRRGGRTIYAFDVTNPDAPRLMWRINPDVDADYTSLGQTWSMPRVALLKGRTEPVLIMGGGYDAAAEDASPSGATTMGRGVYVIDISDGDLIARHVTDYSVPADVSVLDSDGDGFVDRIYVADVRAQLYRIDIESASGDPISPGGWPVTKIAALNDGAGGLVGSRKVFFAPDIIMSRNYTALLMGTGDREKPLTTSTNDRFYVIKDTKVTKGAPAAATLITDAVLTGLGTNGAGIDPEGCSYAFASNGERVINQPITFGGITYFSTNRPLPPGGGSCSRSQSRSYQVPLICRPPTFRNLVGDGLPPSPVVGYVDVGRGKLVPFVIGGPNDKNSSIEVNRANILIPGKRKRSYWFMDNRDR
ncbi:MAG TPA: PilC/PilY family type IV pilus protein [Burkholderiaceae bacterium]|nr:PilC/PilY family type IV pilus protein [Burkholderiaceae bacterium]